MDKSWWMVDIQWRRQGKWTRNDRQMKKNVRMRIENLTACEIHRWEHVLNANEAKEWAEVRARADGQRNETLIEKRKWNEEDSSRFVVYHSISLFSPFSLYICFGKFNRILMLLALINSWQFCSTRANIFHLKIVCNACRGEMTFSNWFGIHTNPVSFLFLLPPRHLSFICRSRSSFILLYFFDTLFSSARFILIHPLRTSDDVLILKCAHVWISIVICIYFGF